MSLTKFLVMGSRRRLAGSTLAALVSGVSGTGAIALVPVLASGGTPKRMVLGLFVSLALLSVASKAASEILLSHIAQARIAELRLQLSRSVVCAPLRELEAVGDHRLLATLNDDVAALSNAFVQLPLALVNLATVLGCLGYLAWLSPSALAVVLAAMVAGTALFELQSRIAARHFVRARRASDDIYAGFRALTLGVKELKLDPSRREEFLSVCLGRSVAAHRREFVAGSAAFSVAMGFGNLLFYIALGVAIVALPAFDVLDAAATVSVALTLLYLMGPFAQLVEILPTLSRAQVALDKVAELGLRLGSETVAPATNQVPYPRAFELLELAGITHRYQREQESGSFQLGPVNLNFRPGEIVFLVGGNGSGKTTLCKLLLGLYEPEVGSVRIDGREVDGERREQLRQLFSVVFADYHVFEALLGLESPQTRERARYYIERFGLQRCVQIEGQALVISGLSQGQRKRLALVAAYLDERPFYVFDEWASDQDPAFRRVFYTELLPELRQRGKAVLVISHDEQYFGVADRCLRMDFGKILETNLPEVPIPARAFASAGGVCDDKPSM